MTKDLEKIRESWLDFSQFKERYQKVSVEEYPNNVLKAVPNPEISVRITTYQHRQYIREAIESVLMQKVDVPWEIIIGDDESTDGTREICIEYAKKYPDLIRLFLHKRENNIKILGNSCGIFQIIYNTYCLRGRFIAGISGDDVWGTIHKLQTQYEFLNNNENYSIVQVKGSVIDQDGNKVFKNRDQYDYPSNAMVKNVFQTLPDEIMHSINEDSFMTQILRRYGKFKDLDNDQFTKRRVVGSNMWTKSKSLDKRAHFLNTSILFYKVFGAKDHKVKRHLANRLIFSNSNHLKKKYLYTDIWLFMYYLYYKVIYLSKC